MVVLKEVAVARGCHKLRRQGDVRAYVVSGVRSRPSKPVEVIRDRRVDRRVQVTSFRLDRVAGRQGIAGFSSILIEPRTKKPNFAAERCVDSGAAEVSRPVLGEVLNAEARVIG